jgi:hypothetical protein
MIMTGRLDDWMSGRLGEVAAERLPGMLDDRMIVYLHE